MKIPSTSGPWRVAAIRGGRIVGDETTISEIDKLQILGAHSTVATTYRRGDARLIAEAPALQKALEDLLDIFWIADSEDAAVLQAKATLERLKGD